MANSEFLNLRSSPSKRRSLLTPNAAALRGNFFQESATAGTAEVADGSKPLAGFVTRDVVVGGPVLGDHIYPGRIDLPFTAAQEASFEMPESFEAEGADFFQVGGTGPVVAGTALQTELAFVLGKLRIAQTADIVEYVIVEQQTAKNAANSFRIRAEKVPRRVK